MTFDFTDKSNVSESRDTYDPSPVGHVMLRKVRAKRLESKEKTDEKLYGEYGKNESRADINGFAGSLDSHPIDHSPLLKLVDEAYETLEAEQYDKAVDTIGEIADQFVERKKAVAALLDHTIDTLSTMYGPAAPPHSGILAVIRKRKAITQ